MGLRGLPADHMGLCICFEPRTSGFLQNQKRPYKTSALKPS